METEWWEVIKDLLLQEVVGGDFAVSNGPQCGAHAGEGLSDRYFTSQDIPAKEVTSSP